MSGLPEIGEAVAGRFVVREGLGMGGMGAVYRATQTPLGREVALKVMLPHGARQKLARDRFLREARVGATLRHPNVVEIFDYGEEDGRLWLAMELLDGPTLRSLVDEDLPPLPVERALCIAERIADVLSVAARLPAVHRDLKPENVVLDRGLDGKERVVVVDFGLAFVGAPEDPKTGRLTREGVMSGTPDYMSPEQARGLAIGPPADVYALGVMLYEMLTARVPFEGDPAVVLSRHLFVRPKSIREAYPELAIPGAIDELVMRMLEKKPEDRPSAAEVRDALASYRPSRPPRMSGKTSGGGSLGRAARMVSAPPTLESAEARLVDTSARIAWLGEPSDQERLALAAHGLDIVAIASTETLAELPDVRVVYVPEATGPRVAALADRGYAVVADTPRGEVAHLAEMLRAGAAEVVTRPVDAAALARKVLRVLRKVR